MNGNESTGMWSLQQIHRIIVNKSSIISRFVWERAGTIFKLTYKECVSNGEGCSQKDGRLYFIVLTAIDKCCSITDELVLIQKKSNYRE